MPHTARLPDIVPKLNDVPLRECPLGPPYEWVRYDYAGGDEVRAQYTLPGGQTMQGSLLLSEARLSWGIARKGEGTVLQSTGNYHHCQLAAAPSNCMIYQKWGAPRSAVRRENCSL
jgi:hypothetical protein